MKRRIRAGVRKWLSVSLAGAATAGALAAGASSSLTQQSKLVPGDVAQQDQTGASVALSGDTAILGAPDKSNRQGAAYVYARSGSTWTLQASLVAGDAPATDDEFGYSVAIEGDTAVVGAIDKDKVGAAYVFTRAGTTWTQQQKLAADDAADFDSFGWSVAVSGDTVVVGAAFRNHLQGGAYVFVRNATTWTQQQKILAADAGATDMFGTSVAVSGDTAVIGAPTISPGSGAAYVYVRSAATWTQQQKLAQAVPAAAGSFGDSVAVSADSAIVGTGINGGVGGPAYVFTRSGVAWSQQAALSSGVAADPGGFGRSVALVGDTAMVGAPTQNGSAGAAFVFTRSGTTWTRLPAVVSTDVATGDAFGDAVAVSGTTALVGAPGKGVNAGVAYVFVGLPLIVSVTPTQISQGATLTVIGGGFGTKAKAWIDVSGKKLALKIAKGATDGGFTALVASVKKHVSGAAVLDVQPRGAKKPMVFPGLTVELPTISTVTPPAAAVGQQVTIAGAFLGAKAGQVHFGTKKCKIVSWADRSITVTVPKGLPTTAVDVRVDDAIDGVTLPGAFTAQ